MPQRLRAMRPMRALLLACGGALLVWLVGFGWFVHASQATPPVLAHADGIVALTGGAGRVEAALRLLAEDRAPILLISGVGPVDFPAIAHRAGADLALAPRVTLGHIAVSTRGNAAEAADWVRRHGIASLIVVTSGYHMQRALAELGRRMPAVQLYAAPVLPGEPPSWRLLLLEYNKLLVTRLGLSWLSRHGDEPPENQAAGTAPGRSAP